MNIRLVDLLALIGLDYKKPKTCSCARARANVKNKLRGVLCDTGKEGKVADVFQCLPTESVRCPRN